MAFDIFDINLPAQPPPPIDPIEIFHAAAVKDENINDLWLGQGDALREWNEHRNDRDVAVVLNTGAGKTMVGLLIAQSLVNETRGHVLYACSTIQLVKQTAAKASGYGLPVTTYYNSSFSSDGLYHRGEAPCVTTYHALFNGRSRFPSDEVTAVVFDDAHTAEHILRGQFSLSITRAENGATYEQILALFEPYHQETGFESSYAEVRAGSSTRQFFVPPFEVHNNISELRRLLLSADLTKSTSTMFAWEHIRDQEDLCCVFVSDKAVTLTPPIIPTSSLSYFDAVVRRVYLSATLSAPDGFVRAFGRCPNHIIAPTTPAGACERLVVIPAASEGIEDDVSSAKDMVRNHKTLILVPNTYERDKWSDISKSTDRENVPQVVDQFRHARPPTKLTLAARYDGIDLPGDTCRVMVLDELPKGTGPLEQYQWDRLNMRNSLRSLLSSRIVQSFGRISRGMSDHGVVVVTGESLVNWLRVPRNVALLPAFLQKQIQIGEAVSKRASGTQELIEAADACLNRDSKWIRTYSNNMRDFPQSTGTTDFDKALEIAIAEAKFGDALWNRDYQHAIIILSNILDNSFEFSQFTGAWLSLWLGYAYELSGDDDSARHLYRRSHGAQQNIPSIAPSAVSISKSTPRQVQKATQQMQISGSGSVRLPKSISRDLVALKGLASSGQVEEALRSLGQYLGLDSTRPDKEYGTGPDVLWIDDEGRAICMEAKTDKKESVEYHKREVSQLHDHIQWTNDNHQVSKVHPIFVGDPLPAAEKANPSQDMRVIDLQEFNSLAERLVSALRDATESAMPLNLEQNLHDVMNDRDLLTPLVFRKLRAMRFSDLSTASLF